MRFTWLWNFGECVDNKVLAFDIEIYHTISL